MVQLQLNSLIALQESDSDIVDLEDSLALIPKQLESAEKELEGKKGKLKLLADEIESLKASRKKFEQAVQEEIDHMAKTKIKLPSVKTNKEYTAILSEVEAIEKKISDCEDKELEIMEKLEAKEVKSPHWKPNSKVRSSSSRNTKRKKKRNGIDCSRSWRASAPSRKSWRAKSIPN